MSIGCTPTWTFPFVADMLRCVQAREERKRKTKERRGKPSVNAVQATEGGTEESTEV